MVSAMKQVPPQSKTPEAMQMKMTVPGRQGGRGMPRGMKSPLTSSFPPTGKYEKASPLVHSGLRKEMEFVGQVGRDVEIPMRRRQETPVGVQREGWPNIEPAVLEPAFYWLVKWVVCFWHHLPDLLMHKEASH